MTREQWVDLFASYRAIWPAARATPDTPDAWFESGMHRLDAAAAGEALMSLAQDATHAPGLATWISATHAARAATQPARIDRAGRTPASREWVARWRIQHRRITSSSTSDAVRARFIEWSHEDALARLPADVLLDELEALAAANPVVAETRRRVGEFPKT